MAQANANANARAEASANAKAKAVLFDVDGTLVRSGGAGRLALGRAAAAVFHRPESEAARALRRVDFRGRTDSIICAEFGAQLGVAVAPVWDTFIDRYLSELDGALAETESELLPGVTALLAALERRPQTYFGLLTGNIREGARKKLSVVGLEQLVDCPGGFGEDGRERHEVAAVAMRRLAAAGGVEPAAVVVIGDTQHDVAAAHHCGAAAVAVATGWTPRAELQQCGAQLVLDDLLDPAPVLQLLDTL